MLHVRYKTNTQGRIIIFPWPILLNNYSEENKGSKARSDEHPNTRWKICTRWSLHTKQTWRGSAHRYYQKLTVVCRSLSCSIAVVLVLLIAERLLVPWIIHWSKHHDIITVIPSNWGASHCTFNDPLIQLSTYLDGQSIKNYWWTINIKINQ